MVSRIVVPLEFFFPSDNGVVWVCICVLRVCIYMRLSYAYESMKSYHMKSYTYDANGCTH